MKVLSIDLDYIMEPSIEIYNGIFYYGNPETRWRTLFEHTPFNDNSFNINTSNLMYCYNVFLKALKNCENVSFGYTHDSILYAIENFSDIDLINIDHHDDVFAGDFDDILNGDDSLQKEYLEIVASGRVNEGNWVAYLKSQGKLKSYTWISNYNSKNKRWNHANQSLISEYYNLEKENYTFPDYNFDHIFVCLSPQYIPHKFWHYFSMFITAYEEFTGKGAMIERWANQSFEHDRRYLKTTDEILHQCSTGR
jgi:hypothetical protein